MAFSYGIFMALLFLLIIEKSSENLPLICVLIGSYLIERLFKKFLSKNEMLINVVNAAISYAVFIAVGCIFLDIQQNGYLNLGKLIVWGILPSIILLGGKRGIFGLTQKWKKLISFRKLINSY